MCVCVCVCVCVNLFTYLYTQNRAHTKGRLDIRTGRKCGGVHMPI